MSDLIDPLNEDTYGRGAIYHHPLRSYLTGKAFEKFYAFREKRKGAKQNIRYFLHQVWKELHK